jgi:hypothetical protein
MLAMGFVVECEKCKTVSPETSSSVPGIRDFPEGWSVRVETKGYSTTTFFVCMVCK